MSKPLPPESEQPEKDVSPPDSTRDPTVQEAAGALVHKTTADIFANLLREEKIDALFDKPINEEDLKPLRDQLNQHPEILELVSINRELAKAKGKDEAEVADLVQKHIEGLARVSQVFLRLAEAQCASPEMDLAQTRVMIHLAHSNAKALSAGGHKNPVALNALKEWQTKLVQEYPEAAKKLVDSYVRSVEAGTAAEKPDFIWLKQWIDLCNGFAPERTPELMEKFHAAAERRCDFFIAKIEQELAKRDPDMSVIKDSMVIPPNYYVHLKQGSTVPERVDVLKREVEALKRAAAGN